ncbi:unnamed protein product [Owenia fusiformis]|uniref:Uncharacterized protein n=1 Tax=Owenia fusiformis TaxID=6347 RepID=A0A8J1Y9P0_OWEFU|nr:unnamed protein product [Owenia fusiformis]
MASKEILLDIIASIQSIPKEEIDPNKSYFEIGGNSINAARILVGLKKKGLKISMPDFLAATSLNELADKVKVIGEKGVPAAAAAAPVVKPEPKAMDKFSKVYYETDKYAVVDLKECEDNANGIEYMTHSFGVRDEMCVALNPKYEDMYEAFKNCWPYTLGANLSVGIVNKKSGKMVACQMNYNFATYDTDFDFGSTFPECILPVFYMIESVETPMKKETIEKHGGTWLFEFIFGTDKTLSHQENLELTNIACAYAEPFAKAKGLKGIAITDTNPVTCALDELEHNYIKVKSIQMNQWEAEDGTKPFHKLPDYEVITALYKVVS